ncbi:MAG TPA: biopolymer transporter ExbD [Gemmataceae bacterium]|nr:biopolymer transporter ExbD [Gemmataceae bacterium]
MESQPGGFSDENLVPLLDLVLQMLMFFMACTNLAKENFNEGIKLPLAQSAKPVDDLGSDILYVNVDDKGNLVGIPIEPKFPDGKIDGMEGKVIQDGRVVNPGTFNYLLRLRQIESYLKGIYKDKKSLAEKRKEDPGVVKTLVILRAHQDANYKDVFNILRLCRGAEFHKMELRATIDSR